MIKDNQTLRPKIWIINQFANSPDMPGGTRHFEIAKYLSDLNWDINVFSSDFNLSKRKYMRLGKMEFFKHENIDGINWYWLNTFSYKKNNWKRYLNLCGFCINLMIFQVLKIFKGILFRNLPDLIIASSPQLLVSFCSLIIAKIIRRPFVFEVRDLWPQVLIDLGGHREKSLFIQCLRWIESFLYINSDCIIILSKGSYNYIKKRGAKKIFWLPNGPDLKEFTPTPYPEVSKKFSFDNPFLLIYAGAHGIANDLDNVLEAAKLIQDHPVKILLIGDGPTKKELIIKGRKLSNVKFKNPISKDLIPKVISSANAILISLKDIKLFQYGISPNKLYDGYALARPIISTAKGSVNDEINQFGTGLTANPGDPVGLAEAIKKMYKLPLKRRKKMGIKGRQLAEKTYSRDRIKIKYALIIKDLIFKK